MKHILESKAVVLGKNIDTDQIYPGRYLALVEPEEIGKHCLEGVDEGLRRLVPGSVLVAGTNFGCGSSREHAVIALLSAGVKAVAAESFARIFFRNAINLGLPLLVCKGLSEKIKTGEAVVVDVAAGRITNKATGETFESERLGEHVMKIIEAGGIKPMIRARTQAEPLEAADRQART